MASWKHIIADSGGSGTSWALCGTDGSVHFVETRSLHPKFALQWEVAEWQELTRQLGNVAGVPLYFYGAGCSQAMIGEQLAQRLRAIGFGEVSVFPDTLGACRATCGKAPGMIAILGTGSILVDYDGAAIVQRIGGYGSLVGDEGSGLHFAKLVVHDYLDGRLDVPASEQTAVAAVLGAREEIFAQLAAPSAQEWLASLAGKLAGVRLDTYHRRNLETFFSLYVPQPAVAGSFFHVVGSYGFHRKELIGEILLESGWKIGVILQNPIRQLVIFHS